MRNPLTIVGLGEALFDVFPDGRQVLGGAPMNVAYHAHQLIRDLDGRGIMITRLGDDQLGQTILDQLREKGMATEFVQIDPRRPTGTVHVRFVDGQPDYEIVTGVAWDFLEATEASLQLTAGCDAICFGSLAQRNAVSRDGIRRLVEAATGAVRMFDVNLRQNYYDAGILDASCRLSTVVKLNDQELPIVARLLELPQGNLAGQARGLREKYDLAAVALTRGAQGTVLFTDEGMFTTEPVSFPPGPHADAVGAGDACSAALLVGMLFGFEPDRIVALANQTGAFAASRAGATPTFPESILEMVRKQ